MRVYFFSEEPAALKLDGQYMGTIDLFCRYAETEGGAFAEIAPHSNGQPLNFFLNDNFFEKTHPFAEVCRAGDEAFIYIKEYCEKYAGVEIIAQKQAAGMLVTVYRMGGIYAAAECENSGIYRLPRTFDGAEIEEISVGGKTFAAVRGRRALALLFEGRLCFFGACDDFETECGLKVKRKLFSCTRTEEESEYLFEGGKFVLKNRTVAQGKEIGGSLLPFAFFEAARCGGCTEYLCDELKGRAALLKEYLGDFVAVVPPTEFAAKKHGSDCAGLVYRKCEGVYFIKYFRAEIDGGKVVNVYEL